MGALLNTDALKLEEYRKAAAKLLDGDTLVDVAASLGITRGTLYNWRQLPEFRAIHAQLSDDRIRRARTIIAGASPAAARGVVSAIDSEREDIALSAAKDVLDRAGVLKGQRIETAADTSSAGVVDLSALSDEELEGIIADAAIKEAEKRGRIIDSD